MHLRRINCRIVVLLLLLYVTALGIASARPVMPAMMDHEQCHGAAYAAAAAHEMPEGASATDCLLDCLLCHDLPVTPAVPHNPVRVAHQSTFIWPAHAPAPVVRLAYSPHPARAPPFSS